MLIHIHLLQVSIFKKYIRKKISEAFIRNCEEVIFRNPFSGFPGKSIKNFECHVFEVYNKGPSQTFQLSRFEV